MRLGDKQRLFSKLCVKLQLEILLRGYAFTWGAAYRDPLWQVGHKRSLHGSRLAVDLNLFKKDDELGWVYCKDTDDHKEIGEWWEKQHQLCRWGGRFDDGNHYSLEHQGMK
jgi:hypothetical protein